MQQPNELWIFYMNVINSITLHLVIYQNIFGTVFHTIRESVADVIRRICGIFSRTSGSRSDQFIPTKFVCAIDRILTMLAKTDDIFAFHRLSRNGC